jgi:hypothetical protein
VRQIQVYTMFGAAWAGETEVTEISVSTNDGQTWPEAEFISGEAETEEASRSQSDVILTICSWRCSKPIGLRGTKERCLSNCPRYTQQLMRQLPWQRSQPESQWGR